MTDNIVERLRLLVPSDSSGAAFDAVNEITRLRNELHIAQEWSARVIAGHEQDIAEITALRAEVERLRAALEEIASGKYSGIVLMSYPPQDPAVNRARAALGLPSGTDQ